MNLPKNLFKIPTYILASIALLTVITYITIAQFGFNFDESLVKSSRVEIKGEPAEINAVVAQIYADQDIDVIEVEVGSDFEAAQVQRVYFRGGDEIKTQIQEITSANENITTTFSTVSPGIKIDFSSQLINFLIVCSLILVLINIILYRKIFDYNYTFLVVLMEMLTILVNIALTLVALSILGYYGWHITFFTFNSFVAYIFSLVAVLGFVSMLFKQSLGDVEYISNVGTEFKNFVQGSISQGLLKVLIVITLALPLLYFYYFRIELFLLLGMALITGLIIKYVYVPILEWYDDVRLAYKKIGKKKK